VFFFVDNDAIKIENQAMVYWFAYQKVKNQIQSFCCRTSPLGDKK